MVMDGYDVQTFVGKWDTGWTALFAKCRAKTHTHTHGTRFWFLSGPFSASPGAGAWPGRIAMGRGDCIYF